MLGRGLTWCVAAGVSLLALPSPAGAQVPVTTCGNGVGVVTETVNSEHFRIDVSAGPSMGGGLSVRDYRDALEAAYGRQVAEFGWPAPPRAAGQTKLRVLISATAGGIAAAQTSGDGTGAVGDNPATPWADQDAQATCLLLPHDFPGSGAMRAAIAREFNRMVLLGIGALSGGGTPDTVLTASSLALMEEETFPEAGHNLDVLWPNFADSLGAYDGQARAQWLALRGLTERFGAQRPGGAEQVLQEFWEATSRGGEGESLGLLDSVLSRRGVSLGQAFHDYAIAARAMRNCSEDRLPWCFARADAYEAAGGPRTDHGSIPAVPGEYAGQIEDDHSIQWVKLPPGRADVTLANTASAGLLQGTGVCSGAQGPVRAAFPEVLHPGQSGILRSFPPEGCTDAAIVVTTASRTSPDALTSTPRAYSVALTAPTAGLSLSLAGRGLGVVLGDLGGIACGKVCSQRYPLGTTVRLTATASRGSHFAGWSGACQGFETTCSLRLTGEMPVSAAFALLPTASGSTTTAPLARVSPVIDGRAPVVRVEWARIARKGRALSVRVRCPRDEPTHCAGLVSISAKARGVSLKVKRRVFRNVPGGSGRTVTFPLSKEAQRLLRGLRSLKVSVRVRAHDDSFNHSVSRRSLTVRL